MPRCPTVHLRFAFEVASGAAPAAVEAGPRRRPGRTRATASIEARSRARLGGCRLLLALWPLLTLGCYRSHERSPRRTADAAEARVDAAAGIDGGGLDAGPTSDATAARDAADGDAETPEDATPRGCPVPEPAAPEGPSREVIVEWGEVASSSGCWFFSGPRTLGRDDRLGERAHWVGADARVMLDFSSGVRFHGDDRRPLVLTRRSCHDHGGTWHVREVLHLEERALGVWAGTYSYEECDVSRGDCPGRCRIDATVRIAPPS